MRPSPWPVLLPPSCPCCLPGRPLCPAAAGLRLLSSSRPWFFGFLCPLRCLCVFWCVVCCPFCLASCCGCWFWSCLVLSVCSSRIDVGLVAVLVASLLRWLRTAEDRRPQHHTHTTSHTHTRHSDFLPPVAFGGWFVPEFVCWFVCLGCPVASSLWHVCFVL